MKRLLRFILWSAAALVTVYALLCAWLSWAGASAKQRALTRLAAEGETLDFKALLPEPIDPAKNFFEIEPLKNMAEWVEDDRERGEGARKRKELDAMLLESASLTPIPFNGIKLGQPVNLTAFADWIRQVKGDGVALPAGVTDAPAVRLALEKARPQMAAFQQAVNSKPMAEFTPSMAQRQLPESLFEMHVPHYSSLQIAGRVFGFHGHACAMAGDADAALTDARVLLRFGTACQREPFLIAALVGMSNQGMAYEIVWQALLTGKASEHALRSIQEDMLPSLEATALQAMRGELAASATAANVLERGTVEQRNRLVTILRSVGEDNKADSLDSFVACLLPTGLFTWNGGHLIESELDMLILPLKKGGLAELYRHSDEHHQFFAELGNKPFQHMNATLTRLFIPAVQQVVLRMIATESLRRQALIACALERYYLQHKAYPATLKDLVPQFLSEVPADLMDGSPMRYRQTEGGRYALWAIGLDGKDDGGQMNLKKEKAEQVANRIYKAEYLGDWAWQYEPAKW